MPMSFDVILCKWAFIGEAVSISTRDLIWIVIIESLLGLDSYSDVNDVVGHEPNWWRGTMDHEPTL